MNALKIAGLMGLCLALFAGATFSSDNATVTGEVVDSACYLRQGAHGADHQECAARCLKNGNPAGLLTDEGKLYTISASAAGYEMFAAKRVRLVGKQIDHTILPEKLEVWKDEAWVDVPLTKFGAPEK